MRSRLFAVFALLWAVVPQEASADDKPEAQPDIPSALFLARGGNLLLHDSIGVSRTYILERGYESGHVCKNWFPHLKLQDKGYRWKYRDFRGNAACRIRPGDTLYAHGRGWVKRVALEPFSIMEKRDFCGNQDWDVVSPVPPLLPGPPLFFTTIPYTGNTNRFHTVPSDTENIAIQEIVEKEHRTHRPDYLQDWEFSLQKIESYTLPEDSFTVVIARFEAPAPPGHPVTGTTQEKENHIYLYHQEKLAFLSRTGGHNMCEHHEAIFEGFLDFDGDGDMDAFLTTTHGEGLLLERHSMGYRPHFWGSVACMC